MAKIVMVCYRDNYLEQGIIKKIELFSKKLIPDNIEPSKTKIIKNNGIIFGIFNPNDSYTLKENRSVYLGGYYLVGA